MFSIDPLVSICIPTYNGSNYIREAMESAISQSYSNCEIIVSDDKSKDNTLEIIETFRAESPFHIHVFHHDPFGIGANWNNCVKNANGDFIKFLFQDDVLEKDCVEKMICTFQKDSSIGLVASKRKFIVDQNMGSSARNWIEKYKNLQIQFEEGNEYTYFNKSIFKRRDFFKSPMNKIGEPSVTMFRKSIINEVGYFDENLKQILDYIFYYKVLKRYSIVTINEPLVSFRIHKDQTTNVNRNREIKDYEIYNKLLYNEFYPYLHPNKQKELRNKYSIKSKMKNMLLYVYRIFS